MRQALLFAFKVAVLVGSGCVSDDDDERGTPMPPPETSAGRVLVLNEGNFRRGNASVSTYDAADGTVRPDALTLEPDRELDVLQSATVLTGDSLLCLVVNNSNELIVAGRDDLRERDRYLGLGSPRYAAQLPDGRLVVSDLYAGGLLVLDLARNTRDTVPAPTHTEGMAVTTGGLVVAAPAQRSLLLYEVTTLELLAEARTAYALATLGVTDGGLILAAAGVASAQDSGAVVRVEVESGALAADIVETFAVEASSFYPRVATHRDRAYVLQRDLLIYEDFSAPRPQRTAQSLRAVEQPYALGVDASSGEVYVGDANAVFSGPGRVWRYSPGFVALDSFAVGPLPSGFVFP